MRSFSPHRCVTSHNTTMRTECAERMRRGEARQAGYLWFSEHLLREVAAQLRRCSSARMLRAPQKGLRGCNMHPLTHLLRGPCTKTNIPCTCSTDAALCAAGDALRAGLVIVASQKGLTVAVPVLAALAAGRTPVLAPGAAGLAVLPAVLCHLAQTALDFALASAWVAHGRRREHTLQGVV